MKKIILSILIILPLGYGIHWTIEMYQFGKAIQEATPEFVGSLLKNELQDGDLIFQTSMSEQSKAIQIATDSKYSHMGIIYRQENNICI